ncbi:SseB family protein [Nesterenkonia natronophila]|uniref:SseB family protein n=1 Tax=Nesterenkonia natronophila TaxID=2174932 RepID=A0A3A4F884_9MICC|nr:SseB family protein [Nesterenkonia natronophila]RJN31084.1 SseB family protein [Nesterenkonia natronophila]
MTETPTETVPELQQALKDATENRTDEGFLQDDVTNVLNAFLNSSVYVASSEDPEGDKGTNLLMVQDDDGNALPVLFTTPEAAGEHKEQAPHVVETNGIILVQSLKDVGVVLDPMSDHQFLIPAEQMGSMRSFVEERLAESETPQQD